MLPGNNNGQRSPIVTATNVGEYIRYNSCERRFKLDFDNRALGKALPFAERLFSSLDPVLAEAGAERETEWEDSLRQAGLTCIAPLNARESRHLTLADIAVDLAALQIGQDAYIRELDLEG
jgi:hypothetical protein